jgi:hypothetical protein
MVEGLRSSDNVDSYDLACNLYAQADVAWQRKGCPLVEEAAPTPALAADLDEAMSKPSAREATLATIEAIRRHVKQRNDTEPAPATWTPPEVGDVVELLVHDYDSLSSRSWRPALVTLGAGAGWPASAAGVPLRLADEATTWRMVRR